MDVTRKMMKMPDIELRVKKHYGDEERTFDFPDSWEVDVLKINNHAAPALAKKQMDDALDHRMGKKISLSWLSKNSEEYVYFMMI